MPTDLQPEEAGAKQLFPGVEKNIARFLNNEWGIERLHPPQVKAIEVTFSGKNAVIAVPTASGKSLIAYLTILHRQRTNGSSERSIYIVPLKALAKEKYDEISSIGKKSGLSVGLAIGDDGGETSRIDDADIVVCTSEKLDAILRRKPSFLDRVGLVIADEVHLLHDKSRGPTLEMNLARIRYLAPHAQIIALSATIGNVDQVAKWLDAESIVSEWRPVRLEMGILTTDHVHISRERSEEGTVDGNGSESLSGEHVEPLHDYVSKTVKEDGQVLIFVNARRSAAKVARDLATCFRKGEIVTKNSEIMVKEWLNIEDETKLSRDQAKALLYGSAFHHAGLTSRQRSFIETMFRNGRIRGLAATPTLAAGVNLPARSVVIRDIRRWEGDGMGWLSVMEIHQMLGRAGRPGLDQKGTALLFTRDEAMVDELTARYIRAPPESIRSKLHQESALRVHLLSTIASGFADRLSTTCSFFSNTFLGHTSQEWDLSRKIETSIEWLLEHGLLESEVVDNGDTLDELIVQADTEPPAWVQVALAQQGVGFADANQKSLRNAVYNSKAEQNVSFGFVPANMHKRQKDRSSLQRVKNAHEKFRVTDFGRTVNRLYLDPLSGVRLRKYLRRAIRRFVRGKSEGKVTDASILHAIAHAPDFIPLRANKRDLDALFAFGADIEQSLLIDHSEASLDEHQTLLKACAVLCAWINEKELAEVEEKYSISPGDLRARTNLARWLLYAAREIIRAETIFSDEHESPAEQLILHLDSLHLRMRYGCHKDAIPLIRIRGVGRKRARTLIEAGITSTSKLADLTEKGKRKLLSKRGWSKSLIEAFQVEARKLAIDRPNKKQQRLRDDDAPLLGEGNS